MVKKLLLSLAIACGLAAPAHADPTNRLTPVFFGFLPGAGIENGGANQDSTSVAATWHARGFNIEQGKTLSKVRLYCSSKTGSPAAGDIHFKLYSASTANGGPGTQIEDKTLSGTPSCPGWVEATGFTTALSASTQYYIVINNTNGTPASNFIVLNRVRRMSYPVLGGGVAGAGISWHGWSSGFSTDSGSTFALGNSTGGVASMRLEFSDGTFAGMPISSEQKDTTNEIFGTRKAGMYFTTGSTWPTTNLIGLSFPVGFSGTKPAQLKFSLYSGTTFVASTQVTEDELVTAASDHWVVLYFTAAQALLANTTYRVVAEAVSGGSAGNSYNLSAVTWDSDSNSTAMLPYSWRSTYFNGTSWAESQSNLYPVTLILDTNGPAFSVPAGPSGKSFGSQFNAGFN